MREVYKTTVGTKNMDSVTGYSKCPIQRKPNKAHRDRFRKMPRLAISPATGHRFEGHHDRESCRGKKKFA